MRDFWLDFNQNNVLPLLYFKAKFGVIVSVDSRLHFYKKSRVYVPIALFYDIRS